MAGNIRSLAAGRTKFTICLEEPADPANPTVAELNAGIEASCAILDSDFLWRATDSATVSEKPLCVENEVETYGASNFEAGLTAFREFDATTKNAHATADAVFQALKTKGSRFWGYARETAKKSTEPWAASDEIYLGAEVITDNPQKPTEATGSIKRRIPMKVQTGYPEISVKAA